MKTKRFDFDFKPLRILTSFGVVGSVPGRQVYDSNLAEYTPDYSVTPLVLRLSVSRQDPDEVLANGEVNNALTNVRFYEIKNGVKTQILAANTDYTIETSGNNAGRILVNTNVAYLFPVTIIVEADYLDTRLNQTHHIKESFLIICDNGSPVQPEVELDIDDQTVWNPLADADSVVITAKLRLGAALAAYDSHLLFKWQKLRGNGTWSDVGAVEYEDYDCAVSSEGQQRSLTVNRRLMGPNLRLRCVALYNASGSVSGMTIGDSTPQRSFDIVRRIPKYEYDIHGVPTNIPPGSLYISPEAVVKDGNGVVANPDRELHLLWKAASNQQSGSLTYETVGEGMNPSIPTRKIVNQYGMVLGLDPVDAGPEAAWLDSDDAYIVDSDGAILLIK